MKTISAKVSEQTALTFDERVRQSGLTRDEFLSKLLSETDPNTKNKIEDTKNNDTTVKADAKNDVSTPEKQQVKNVVEKIVQVERPLEEHELLISLNPFQLFALKETVLGKENFAAAQNKIIDRLQNDDRPFLYFGKLYRPEFLTLWMRLIEVTKEMSEDEKLNAVKHNMAAYLINFFHASLIEGQLSDSVVTADILQEYISNFQKS